jgi:hypothetical protein
LASRLDGRRARDPVGGIERNTTQGRDPKQRETRGRAATRPSHQGHDAKGRAAINDQGVQFVEARRQALENREQCAAGRRIEVRGTTDQNENRPGTGQTEFGQGGRQTLGRGLIQTRITSREQGVCRSGFLAQGTVTPRGESW